MTDVRLKLLVALIGLFAGAGACLVVILLARNVLG
jgi:hypothetical protein